MTKIRFGKMGKCKRMQIPRWKSEEKKLVKINRRAEKSAEKQRRKDMQNRIAAIANSNPYRKDILLEEAERLTQEVKQLQENMLRSQRDLKLIKKELRNILSLEAQMQGEMEENSTPGPSRVNFLRKKSDKKQKKPKKLARQVENLITTLSETVLE
ncbi:hypothetical protein Ddc_06010 [Ditylenchus destructor]|nr:hypothetical protein Ddc_06010 [Ditylenchus destructor]